MDKKLLSSNSYVNLIKDRVGENNSRWGIISVMAKACGCQQSHLSRVVNGKAHLTLEQAAGLADYFGYDDLESEFFLNLVQLARAGTNSLKNKIKRRLNVVREEQEDLSKRLSSAPLGFDEKEFMYYSSWYWSAIHVLVSIPEYQNAQSISQKLSLSVSTVNGCLEALEKYNLVYRERGRWKTTSSPIHLSKKSSMISLHHNNWRNKAVLASQAPTEGDIHYTVVQSVSQSDFQKIKQIFLNTIDEYVATAGPSKEEELACFCLDWFKV